jgi:hypothetical protein
VELAEISLKYTSRISDLRAMGYRVDCEKCPRGLSVYTLIVPAPVRAEQLEMFA